MFSLSIQQATKNYLNNIIKMRVVLNLGQYLGLPSTFTRSKSKDFKYFLDKIWSKLQGWKSKLFSSGEKETLIKSVVQAIPTYAIGCFWLPKTITSKIYSLCANFWWGSREGKRKIHWMRWKRLYLPKEMSGLNFHDIEGFNRAMLAKLA